MKFIVILSITWISLSVYAADEPKKENDSCQFRLEVDRRASVWSKQFTRENTRIMTQLYEMPEFVSSPAVGSAQLLALDVQLSNLIEKMYGTYREFGAVDLEGKFVFTDALTFAERIRSTVRARLPQPALRAQGYRAHNLPGADEDWALFPRDRSTPQRAKVRPHTRDRLSSSSANRPVEPGLNMPQQQQLREEPMRQTPDLPQRPFQDPYHPTSYGEKP